VAGVAPGRSPPAGAREGVRVAVSESETAARKTVLVTGAAGYVASQLLPAFRERYDLRLVDITREGRGGWVVDDVLLHDLRETDLERHRALFAGAHAVVHLAHNRGPRPGGVRRYEDEKRNVDMAYHVYQLALEEGLERVVMASSNHAADWYEDRVLAGEREAVTPDERPLARTFYGWAKAAYEHMGFLYAQGTFGRPLGVVQVRIGHPRGLEHYDFTGRPGAFKRNLGAFISARDLAQLFCRALDTPDIADAGGVPFQIVYGISDNTRAFWSLSNARRVLGYAPQDDSELLYAETVARLLGASPGRSGTGGDE